MSEKELRATIARIDELRADAKLLETMHTHWMGHNGELVEIYPVVIRRRWRGEPKVTHSERVMNRAELGVLISWLYERARARTAEADALAATLNPENQEQPES